jgi:replication initiation protein RepC
MQMLGFNPIAPFGCGALSPAALRIQRDVRQCQPGKACHKWKTFRHACEAKAALALSDRALTVLNALLSFHPDTVLTLGSTDLVVFPSNRELSLRAHGIPASTLRRHIAALVKSGLIQRRDRGRLRESVKSYAKRRAAVSHSRAGFPLGRHTDRALPV